MNLSYLEGPQYSTWYCPSQELPGSYGSRNGLAGDGGRGGGAGFRNTAGQRKYETCSLPYELSFSLRTEVDLIHNEIFN